MFETTPRIAALASIAFSLVAYGVLALAQSAPFGLSWGDRLESLPESSARTKEKNITVLLYKMDANAGYRDTDEITLKVCGREGLQQAMWMGRPLSGEDARGNFASAFKEAVRRYGKPDEGDPASGTASWHGARVTMFAKLVEPGNYRIFMVMDGPAFEACGRNTPKKAPTPRGSTLLHR